MKRVLSLFLFVLVVPQAVAFAQTVTTPVIPDADSSQDREPAIIVQNVSGADRVITSWIRRNAGVTEGQLKVAAINESSLTSGTWDKPSLPCPFVSGCASNDVSGDPILAENPYTTGVSPKRVYLIGASKRVSNSDENQISVWSTDNGGSSWSNFAALDHQSNGTWLTDKPSIAVSWQSSTRGRVYAAHLRYNSASDCGGATHSRMIVTRVDGTVTELANIDSGVVCASSPIILIHTSNAGWMNVVWLNWETNQINVATSFDGFSSYAVHTKAAGTLLGPVAESGNCATNNNDAIYNGAKSQNTCSGLGAKIRARSMLMARFNSISGTLGITWHARETTDPNASNFLSSDVKFVEFTPYTYGFGSVWTVTDSPPTSGAQWNPALDYDSNGQYLVSYYDTRGLTQSSSQFNYHVKTARIASGGIRTGASDTQLTSAPSNLLVYSDIPRNGEYMDIWNWNSKFYAAFIQIGTHGDPAVVRITP